MCPPKKSNSSTSTSTSTSENQEPDHPSDDTTGDDHLSASPTHYHILDSNFATGSVNNPQHRVGGNILGRTSAGRARHPGIFRGLSAELCEMLEKIDWSKVIEESLSRLLTTPSRGGGGGKQITEGAARFQWRSGVIPPTLAALYDGDRPIFSVVNGTGSDGRLKIMKFENGKFSDLDCYSATIPTVEMSPDQDQNYEDGTDDDEDNKKKVIAAKGKKKLDNFGSESLSEKMESMCKIIIDDEKYSSGVMTSARDYGPSRLSSENAAGPSGTRSDSGPSDDDHEHEEMMFGGNDASNNNNNGDDDRQEEAGDNQA